MEKPWEADNCAAIKAHYAVYSIPQVAALWCGVPEDQVDEIVREAKSLSTSGFGRGVWTHYAVPCMEPRSRAIAEAIEDGSLPHGREDGQTVQKGDSAAAERRHVFGRDLKIWMEKAFPNEKPPFLFDDIERTSHTAISADAYRALKAEHDKLDLRLKAAIEKYKELREEKEQQERISQSLEAALRKTNAPEGRAETTYLNIIGALLKLMLAQSPGGKPYSSFDSQSSIISALLAHDGGKPGLSQRTLEEKFATANRELTST